ncbi:hypothetical protein ASE86_14650 [Sphingomonas sp. Leaf33]|nr:hypothetical protein ASE86_14650 [Sphingomonas sp. Leaf33]
MEGTAISPAARTMRIVIEPGTLISTGQELAVLRAAYKRQPDSRLLRGRLATALLVQDAFDDVIAVLSDADGLDARDAAMLVQAHLARESEADNLRVVDLVDQMLPLVDDDAMRAQFLADQGKALRRLGHPERARAVWQRALTLDPANKDACKRIATLDLQEGALDDGIATLDRLATGGANHARLYAARALAEARAGRIDAARDMVAFDGLHFAGQLATPPGMPSLAAFNARLAAELLQHPNLRYERYGSASEQTWRIDTPALGDAPMVRLLLAEIARAVEHHADRIADSDHPWARQRPDIGMLHCWCVMTDGTGYETWHVHQFGWLSGVYYVQIPDAVTHGDDAAGCIAFGLPEDVVGDAAASAYGVTVVRPEEGMLMLFPSHTYHRTFPHGADQRRICVAFDIWPG